MYPFRLACAWWQPHPWGWRVQVRWHTSGHLGVLSAPHLRKGISVAASFIPRLTAVAALTVLTCTAALALERGTVPAACAAELAALRGVHPVAARSIGAPEMERVKRAANAHGGALLLWKSENLEARIAADPDAAPARLAYWRASSKLLRCLQATEGVTGGWRAERDFKVPTASASFGDLVLTANGRCAALYRADTLGLVGVDVSENDVVAIQWSGGCRNGGLHGRGKAQLVLRSGQKTDGALGRGNQRASYRFGLLEGDVQVSSASAIEPGSHDLWERYKSGYLVTALMKAGQSNELRPMEFARGPAGWGWVAR